MLSRVADSLYWISRYIERAENVSRLLDVNSQIMLDYAARDAVRIRDNWEPIVRSMGDIEAFQEAYDRCDHYTVTDYLTLSADNPGSIRNCMLLARENARMIRDQISAEMWATLNDLYLFLRSANARKVWDQGPANFYQRIRETSHLFQGLTDATFPRHEGFLFLQIGKYLERAENTARIVDIKYHVLLPSLQHVGGAVDTAQWVAILRSCGALEAYLNRYVADVAPGNVAEFLLLSEQFPRSLRFGISRLDHYLRNISGYPETSFANRAEQLSGRLFSELKYSTTREIFERGLHETLVSILDQLNQVGDAVYETYLFSRPFEVGGEEVQQQQQQQQRDPSGPLSPRPCPNRRIAVK